jgi:competence protein ComEC
LPSPWWCLIFVFLVPASLIQPALRWVLALTAGWCWALLYSHVLTTNSLPTALEGQDVQITGQIATLPQRKGIRTRFAFDIESAHLGGQPVHLPHRVRLGWYGKAPQLASGERWQLTVRLKRPHGFMNPGGFNYEGWLFRNHIRATGYVRSAQTNKRLQPAPFWHVNRVRQWLTERITSVLRKRDHQPFMRALAVGDRSAITGDQWQTLLRTGTNHLMAISGLHIGLVAGLVFMAIRACWRRSERLTLMCPAYTAAAGAALVAAACYAALAGFAIPAQRALIMVCVAMLVVVCRRHVAVTEALGSALLVVLIINPLSVLAPGFWLSFAAVAIILLTMRNRLRPGGPWWRWGRVQWTLAVGLTPLLLLDFGYTSLISPLCNLIAVPWISLVVVPLVLAGTVSLVLMPTLGTWLLSLAEHSFSALFWVLEQAARLPFAHWYTAAQPTGIWVIMALGILILLLPRGMPLRYLGTLCVLPMLLIKPDRPEAGEFWFTLLDVGQGLSGVVETATHTLVYDTGARFSGDFDAGSAVVVPFLRARAITSIDTLVLGHGDNDHVGGATSLANNININQVLRSQFDKLPDVAGTWCQAGQHWQWDGVRFTVLHPANLAYQGNDSSCVLKVSADAGSVLLTGDIERVTEARLLQSAGPELASDVLVVPHHGSTTSSSAAFIEGVGPAYALFPVGYRNRYQFPRPEVVKRYRERGIKMLDSARHGAITFKFRVAADIKANTFRQSSRYYWHTR